MQIRAIGGIVITEVFVAEETKARGYVITSKTTNVLLYFIDVDRIDHEMITKDFDKDETMFFENINELEKYAITNELDFMEIIEEYAMELIQERKFWGWQQWVQCDRETGEGYVFSTYYVAGIPVKTKPVMGNGGQLIQPCAGGALLDD